jgi:hypothetical protein
MTDALAEIERIESRSAGRLKKSSEPGVSTKVVLMQFESPSEDTHAQKS